MEENKNSYSGIKGFFLGVLVTLAVGSAVFLVKNWDYVVHKEMKPTELGAKTKVSDIYERIQDAYLGEIDDEKLTDYMCTGLVAGLEDKYSTYYTQEQYEKMIESANGHYSGIGISILADESGKVVIESCGENTPAAEAGITAGDILLEIDGTRVTGMTASEAAKLIQNKKEGEVFSMTLNREGKDYTVEIAVREVEAISVAGSMLDEQVGYIRISEFTGVTSADSYQKLKDQNMTKLIIDLRSNPGGLVSGVCDTLRQILPKGLIVYTEDKYGSRKEQTCDGETPIDISMVVLVNGSSASASEIFAGAVQDYGVGTIVGTVTYGKGVVQDTYPLDNGGAVKLTVSHYFTPKGNDINGKGITPDVVCELPDDASEDLQIEKAKEILGR